MKIVRSVVVAALAVASTSALAQVERSGGGANAQLAQQYQQVVSERTQLQSENAKLKKDLEELKKQAATATGKVTALEAGAGRGKAALAAAQAANDASAKSAQDLKNKLQELVGSYRETIANLKKVETERGQLQQRLTQDKAKFDTCAQRNYDLYKVNVEILDRYEHQGAFSYLARSEPFTRIKRTQIENLVDEYRQRAEELRVEKSNSGNSAAAAADKSAPARQ
jgi:chromosome segregation ATPase